MHSNEKKGRERGNERRKEGKGKYDINQCIKEQSYGIESTGGKEQGRTDMCSFDDKEIKH